MVAVLGKLTGQLIFGQDYEGRYRPMFNGVYTRQVPRFQVTLDDGVPSVPGGSKIATAVSDAYRRRDLNVVPILERTGINAFAEKALVLSGVFTPETGVWTPPMLVGASGNAVMDLPTVIGQSVDLESWTEMTGSLSDTGAWPLEQVGERRFHRRLTAVPTVP